MRSQVLILALTAAMVAILVPVMVMFPEIRYWLALAVFAYGVGNLIWWWRDKRRSVSRRANA